METTKEIESTPMVETEVSARQGFLLVGQERWRDRLYRLARSPRKGHAHLLAGAPGVGTEALAFHFAAALLCPQSTEAGPCWQCATCQNLLRLEHPRLHLVFPLPRKSSDENDPFHGFNDKLMETIHQELKLKAANPYHTINIPGANEIRIASIRFLRKQLLLQAEHQTPQVALILQAHTMNAPAFNALLKILEEPPLNTYFILTAPAVTRLPETILSRCQQHRIPAVSAAALENYLRETAPKDSGELMTWVQLSQGNVETAQLLMEQGPESLLGEVDLWIDALQTGETGAVIKVTRRYHRRSIEGPLMDRWLAFLMFFFREVMAPASEPLPHWREQILTMRRKFPHADWPAIILKIEATREAVGRKVYLSLAMADLLLSVLKMLRAGKENR